MLGTAEVVGTPQQPPIRTHSPFLLLPVELRGEIYSQVLSLLTSRGSAVDPSSSSSASSSSSSSSSEHPERAPVTEYGSFNDKGISLTRSPTPSPHNTGLISLLLTSRQVYHELTAHLDRTYLKPGSGTKSHAELELIVTLDELTPTWTVIPPVPLSQWKTIVVKMILKTRVTTWWDCCWGCCFPVPIGRRLLRLLGMFVQYGPSFREDLAFGKMGSSISPPRIALDEVAICVNEDFGGAGEQDVVLSERLFGYTGFNIYLSDVARSGLMFGKVKLLRASIKGLGNEIVWVVERRGEEAVRKKAIRWSEYGWVPGGFLKD